ncbi:MAG TPA: hypothetical protein VEG42_00850, partial [Thermoplasmata archaeon]|nr:hypothetical protein [Thermoplasmata archaeon]
SGDGLEAYLFMSPEHATSWSTPYYATDPDGANGTFWSPQGAVLFPYSATPYVVVQWDPAYGSVNSVTLYVVTPGVDGVVTRGSIDATAIGSGLVESPVATSFIALNVTYDATHNYLQGTVVEESTGLDVVSFNASLQKLGFQPTYSVGSAYYFGAGGSGNGQNGWGLLYLSLSQVGGPSSGGLDLVLVFLTVGIVGFAIAAAVIIVLLRKKH